MRSFRRGGHSRQYSNYSYSALSSGDGASGLPSSKPPSSRASSSFSTGVRVGPSSLPTLSHSGVTSGRRSAFAAPSPGSNTYYRTNQLASTADMDSLLGKLKRPGGGGGSSASEGGSCEPQPNAVMVAALSGLMGTAGPQKEDLPESVAEGGESLADKYTRPDDLYDLPDVWQTPLDLAFYYIKIIFPHVGLVLLLVVYTVVGAGVFHIIELPNEKGIRNRTLTEIWSGQRELVQDLWNISQLEYMTEKLFKQNADQRILAMEERLFDAYDEGYVSFKDIKNQTKSVWTFPASIFFATTVITTIGYGHMAPRTTAGRIVCIVFGLFGIPLLLITIADIGKFLSDLITFIYRSYRTFKWQIKRRSKQLSMLRKRNYDPSVMEAMHSASSETLDQEGEIRIPVWMVLLFLTFYTALGGFLFNMLEGWSYFEAFYFCFITMATVGFGDMVPSRQMYMFFTMIYILIGLAITTMCIDLAGTEYIRKIHYFGQKLDTAKDVVGGAVAHGLHAGQDLMEQMKLAVADGRLPLDVRALALLKSGHSLESGEPGSEGQALSDELLLQLYPELSRDHVLSNILWEPLSPEVKKILKPHIKIMPDEIAEEDAMVLENKVFEKPIFGPNGLLAKRLNEEINVDFKRRTWPPRELRDNNGLLLIAPFLLHETDV